MAAPAPIRGHFGGRYRGVLYVSANAQKGLATAVEPYPAGASLVLEHQDAGAQAVLVLSMVKIAANGGPSAVDRGSASWRFAAQPVAIGAQDTPLAPATEHCAGCHRDAAHDSVFSTL
jgi:hypothetical protein